MIAAFQASSRFQGLTYERLVAERLARDGWTIGARNWHEPQTGTEIDIVARDPDGNLWWIECKGSTGSGNGANGCRRSDTLKKAIADAWHLSTIDYRGADYMLITTDPPICGGHPDRMLQAALDHGIVTSVLIMDWNSL